MQDELTEREKLIVAIAKEEMRVEIEKAYLALPKTFASLIDNHVDEKELTGKFFKDYPEFDKKRDAVTAVLAKIDGENPFIGYEKKLEKAVPEIRQRIKDMSKMDMDNVNLNPDRSFRLPDSPKMDNGAI